jgi:hypothetical protein
MAETTARAVRGIIISGNPNELIVRPTDGEVRAFAANTAVTVAGALDRASTGMIDTSDPYLYNGRGERVAFVTDIEVSTDRIDVTSFGNSMQTYAPGQRRISISARGLW